MTVMFRVHFMVPAKARTTSLAHLRVALQRQLRISGRPRRLPRPITSDNSLVRGLRRAELSGHVIPWAEKGQCRPMLSTLSTGVLAIVLLGAAPGWATTVIQKSFAEVVQEAEVIAVGTVTTIATEWDAAHNRPFTLVTFSTLDVLKGAHPEPELTLRVLGGPHPDGSLLQIVGVPEFSLGDRLVVFVTGNDHYAVPLVGLWQGVVPGGV